MRASPPWDARAETSRSKQAATTQLGRRFILEGLQRAEAAEAAEASPELVAMVAKALDQSRGAIADAVARSLVGRLAETA